MNGRTLSIRTDDDRCYVAIETVHALHFARFAVDGAAARLDALTSVRRARDDVSLSYADLTALLPPRCVDLWIARRLEGRLAGIAPPASFVDGGCEDDDDDDDDEDDPMAVFDYRVNEGFSPRKDCPHAM